MPQNRTTMPDEHSSAALEESQAHVEMETGTTGAGADPYACDSAAVLTLRQRRAKADDAPVAQRSTVASTIPVAPAPVNTSASPVADPSLHPTVLLSPSCVVISGFGLIGAFFLSTLISFLLVQLYVVDGADVGRTLVRLEMAGKGREWFPMWMSNFIISALTARRVTDEDDAGGGGSFGEHFDQRRGLAPPQLIRSKRAPPLVPEGATSGSGSAVAENTSISATQTSPSTRLRCYTLEDYSATFLHPRRMSTPPPLFSCGTRVVDLRSEGRPEVLAACQAGLGVAWRRTGSADSNRESDSLFPTLRVVLTPREVRWHSDVQPVNVVSQRIPLSRVNDDYCDCLDGTDELLTNACSMSGPLTPAAGTRWKSYLISNQQLRLWEADDVIAQEDAEARGYPLQRRKHGDVGDRLYVSTGPVLPFVCTCGTVTQLLAPSLVGDGIVDCCAAEDEVVLQGTPYDGASPHRLSGDPAIVEANDRALEAARAAMLVLWKQRRVSASQYKIATPSPYADRLYPHHTSARAMLVDKGYYSLYTSLEVQQEKQAAAAVLEGIYAHGHQIQRDRVERGWDQLGRHLVDNRTQLQLQLSNVTRELESLEEYVRYRMGEARTNDPLAAGVPMHHLQHHARLMHMHDVLTSEVQHISLTTLHRAYGDHYEYYPLARRIMHLEASHLVDPSTSTTLDPATALQREARIITPTEVERRNTAAYAAQQPPPPLHVDNISVSDYGLEVMHQVFVAQRFDSREAPLVAQRLGLLPSHDISAYTPDIFNRTTSPFQRAPVIPIGSWQPYQSHRNSRVMVIADPAGDVHLARRACVTPASTLFRGGGRLQWPTRYPEAPHAVSVADAEEVKKTPKDKLKAASAGETAKVSQRYIPHHTNTPSVFAVDVYTGGIHCEPDRLQGPGRTLQIHVAYLCDPEDGILHWAKNGKCLQEVVIGTPSACTAWAWKVATNRLKEVGKAAKV